MFGIGDCGLMLEPQLGMGAPLLLETARQADGLGFGYLLRSDHLLPTNGRSGIDSPECWTSLGAIAATTSRLRFGPLVSPVGFRNPALLARMACTVSSLSGGRLTLALGAGWYEAEYAANGIPFPPLRVRRDQFREALSIIVPMVKDGRVDFDGAHFSAHGDCFPRPPGPLPIVIGGKTDGVIRLAARFADEWNILAGPADYLAAKRPLLDRLSAGRRVAVSEMGPFLIGRDAAELEANATLLARKLAQQTTVADLLKRVRARGAFCGTPEEFAAAVASRLDAGVERFYFQALAPESVAMTELLAQTLRDKF